jgi:23S rRNA (cytosine1962-C5)-methyltransferase
VTAENFQLLVSDDWSDYALLDSGDMRKLERFGKVRVNRPDPQRSGKPKTPVLSWKADATFASKDDEDERGAWNSQANRRPTNGLSDGTR